MEYRAKNLTMLVAGFAVTYLTAAALTQLLERIGLTDDLESLETDSKKEVVIKAARIIGQAVAVSLVSAAVSGKVVNVIDNTWKVEA